MHTIERTPHSLISRLNADERISGYYRYIGATRRRHVDGHESWHVQLTDRSGVLDAFAPCSTITPLYPMPPHQLVYAEFRTHQYRQRLVAELLELDTLVVAPGNESVVDRLPRSGTHIPNCLDHLTDLLNGLTVPALRRFVDLVLSRDELALAWIGDKEKLFLNAVIAAEIAAEMPYFQVQERDLIVVGALFRDLGRVTLHPERNSVRGVAPGVLTIERCAAGLAWLEQAWPYGAGCLRQIWAGDAYGEEPSQATVLGHAVGLMAKMARGDVSGALWLASQRRLPQ